MTQPPEQLVTRFAPSPTGLLHLGHLYAALYARDLAAAQDGTFLLRFEDIDTSRVRDTFYTQILHDLHTLGIKHHGTPLRQISRQSDYLSALEKLKSLGILYPCFCTRKDIQRELQHLTQAPHGPDGPLYPGTCRHLSPSVISAKLAAGETPSWRLDCQRVAALTGPLSFHDNTLGIVAVDHSLLGDVILARKDIGTSYHIAVVVDDAYQQITDVTRGKDLLESTHVHRILQTLLELPEPRYHHHDLVCDSSGQRLAKRDNALALNTLIAAGAGIDQLTAQIEANLC